MQLPTLQLLVRYLTPCPTGASLSAGVPGGCAVVSQILYRQRSQLGRGVYLASILAALWSLRYQPVLGGQAGAAMSVVVQLRHDGGSVSQEAPISAPQQLQHTALFRRWLFRFLRYFLGMPLYVCLLRNIQLRWSDQELLFLRFQTHRIFRRMPAFGVQLARPKLYP